MVSRKHLRNKQISDEKEIRHISVGFTASSYGGGSPCDNEEEVNRAVKNFKNWIEKEGDIPEVKDLRGKQFAQSKLFCRKLFLWEII